MAENTFHHIAAPLAERFGFRMIPVPVGGKGPVWKDWPVLAACTPEGIRALQARCNTDRRYTEWNAGCVADPDVHCALDCDQPDLVERIERETGQKMPRTFTVRSGGKGTPHYYFRPTAASTAIGNKSTGEFDFWVSRHQTVAPGSLHASGRRYEVIDDSDLAEIPDWLCNWIAAQQSIWSAKSTGASDDSAVGRLGAAYKLRLEVADMFGLPGLEITTGQHPTMLYVAGLLHDGVRDEDQITEILCALWDEYCVGRAHDEDELRRIARHVLKGEPAILEPKELPSYSVGKVVFSSESSRQAYLAALKKEDGSEKTIENPYPLRVWDGTLYQEFASLCGRNNFVPREYFIESLKTIAGAVVGKYLEIDRMDGGVPRFDTVLIGPPSCGKNTAIHWALEVFKVPGDDPETRLIWGGQDTPTANGLGACRTRISSASGLAKFIPSTGKSQNIPQPRLLLVYTELAELLEKVAIDGSGGSLVGAICDLYDGEDFDVPALKDQKPFGGQLLLSLLGGIQPERWNDFGGGNGVENSGIFSRWNLIPTNETRSVSYLDRPDFSDFRASLTAMLPREPHVVTATGIARNRMNEWFRELRSRSTESGVSDVSARLNILAWRNALHYAWMTGSAEISSDAVDVGIALSDYQFVVRGQHTPLVGDNRLAKYMNKMRRLLELRGTVPWREFRRLVNYRRMGADFDRAYQYLVASNELSITDDAGKKLVVWSGGE